VRIWPALAADVICILVFAIVGRSSHNESSNVLGVLHTAWPFLTGYLVGLAAGRGWRRPLALPIAVTLWLSTVGVAMVIRLLTGAGAPLPFVVVTTVVLGALLLGWRGVVSLVQRARARAGHGAAA